MKNPTPTGRTNRMGTPKKSQIHEQTHQAAGQHYLQSQNKNAASEKQLQKQIPEPYLQSMRRAGGVPKACPGGLRSPAPSRWVQGIQQRNILRQPKQTQDNSNQHPKPHGPAQQHSRKWGNNNTKTTQNQTNQYSSPEKRLELPCHQGKYTMMMMMMYTEIGVCRKCWPWVRGEAVTVCTQF